MPLFLESRIHFSGASMRVDSDAGDRPPDWVATRPGSPCLVVPHASPSNTASFFDNHTARSRHSEAIWKAVIQHRRSLTFREHSRSHISRRGRGQACTSVRLRECGWEDLRDGCAAFLVFRVGSARTLMRKDAPPTMGTPEDTSPWRHTHHEGPTPIRATRHRGRRASLPRPDVTPQETLPSRQESSTTPVGNGYRAHRTGCCGSCWCLQAGRGHRLVERTPQRRGDPHGTSSAHTNHID